LLHFDVGLYYEEVGERLGATKPVVCNTLSRALAMIRDAWHKRERFTRVVMLER